MLPVRRRYGVMRGHAATGLRTTLRWHGGTRTRTHLPALGNAPHHWAGGDCLLLRRHAITSDRYCCLRHARTAACWVGSKTLLLLKLTTTAFPCAHASAAFCTRDPDNLDETIKTVLDCLLFWRDTIIRTIQ